MRKLFSFFSVAAIVILSSCSQEEIQPELNNPESMPFGGCFLTQTHPDDGDCPGEYTFNAASANSYSWVLSGDANFSSATNGQQAVVIPDREYWTAGEFTITLYRNGQFACQKDFFVQAEYLCQ